MLGTSWECHKVREFALRPMGDFLLVLDQIICLKQLLLYLRKNLSGEIICYAVVAVLTKKYS